MEMNISTTRPYTTTPPTTTICCAADSPQEDLYLNPDKSLTALDFSNRQSKCETNDDAYRASCINTLFGLFAQWNILHKPAGQVVSI